MERHLGIDFLWILVDFWKQVGEENGAKIDPRRHRKNDGKVDSAKMATKSQQDATTTRGGRGPELRGGGRGRGKPLPEGRGEVGSYQYTMLNHLSPGAGGITTKIRPPIGLTRQRVHLF